MPDKLTKRDVDRLISQADPARDTIVWDGAVPGLVLRMRSGSARFAFQYKHRGRTRRVSIGAYGALTLDQARDQARPLYAQIRAGGDPSETRRAGRMDTGHPSIGGKGSTETGGEKAKDREPEGARRD